MKIYSQKADEQKSFWQKLGTANFWTNDFLPNLGFTAGTALGFASLFIF